MFFVVFVFANFVCFAESLPSGYAELIKKEHLTNVLNSYYVDPIVHCPTQNILFDNNSNKNTGNHSNHFAVLWVAYNVDDARAAELSHSVASMVSVRTTADLLVLTVQPVSLQLQIVVKYFGMKLIVADQIDNNLINPKYLKYLKKNGNCCGASEFIKQQVWLLNYKKAMLLDADVTIAKNIDHLFACKEDIIFASGNKSPLNAGMIVITPNKKDFEIMWEEIKRGEFANTDGWHHLGYPPGFPRKGYDVPYGYEGPQGFWYYYFVQKPKFDNNSSSSNNNNTRAIEVDKCKYNFQPFCNGEDVYVIHKTRTWPPKEYHFKYNAMVNATNFAIKQYTLNNNNNNNNNINITETRVVANIVSKLKSFLTVYAKEKAKKEQKLLLNHKDNKDYNPIDESQIVITRKTATIPNPFVIFVTCLQSSGCSLFSYILSQSDDTIGIVDLWVGAKCPSRNEIFDNNNNNNNNNKKAKLVVIKKVVTASKTDVSDCMKILQPDLKILFLRHPIDNVFSLTQKFYGCSKGSPLQKLQTLENLFVSNRLQGGVNNNDDNNSNSGEISFEKIVYYEDLFATNRRTELVDYLQKKTNGVITIENFKAKKSTRQLLNQTVNLCQWCLIHYRQKGAGWAYGHVKQTGSLIREFNNKADEGCFEKSLVLLPHNDDEKSLSALSQNDLYYWKKIETQVMKYAPRIYENYKQYEKKNNLMTISSIDCAESTIDFSKLKMVSECMRNCDSKRSCQISKPKQKPESDPDLSTMLNESNGGRSLLEAKKTTIINSSKKIKKHELKFHSDKDSLWLMIFDKVYDVTTFLESHPGGEYILLKQGGKRNSTNMFVKYNHSSEAKELMKQYYIGDVDLDS